MQPLIPMEPVSSDTVPEGPEWITQVKWDGVRLLVYRDGEAVRLYNRKGRDRTRHYPELWDVNRYCPEESVVLDGELIALGPDGKPSFQEVMRRNGIRKLDAVSQLQKEVPVVYMVFDILYHRGAWVMQMALRDRLDLLSRVIRPGASVQLVSSYAEGKALWEAIQKQDMEGVVSKRLDAPYYPGQKRDVWRKVKHYQDVVAVIGGYTVNDTGEPNAVLLGLPENGERLRYIGHAGSGRLTSAAWRQLSERLVRTTVQNCPFAERPVRLRSARWVRPDVWVRVRFAQWTPDGRLRQPLLESVVGQTPLSV
ncbi:MAG: DNA ligase [Alicyclobacillus sp.]|nr:DNA ligase [Alicyclobacillus sp.]